METLLKPPEIIRDENGRFDRHGKALAKTAKNRMNNKKIQNIPVEKRGPGRPPGSPNKVTAALKDMILQSLDDVGGRAYLATLAIENSSAYAGLLGKVLPTTLATDDSNGGLGIKMTFERHIVWPDGHRSIEGVTPKQLPAPTPRVLPNDATVNGDPNDINDLD